MIVNQLMRASRRLRYEIAKRIMPSTAELGPKIVPPLTGPLLQRDELKLNVGCGPMHLDGYLNIDRDPRACADVYLDFTELGAALSPGSVTEVLMVHSLSYLNLWQARDFFALSCGLLCERGKLIIELPSIEKCATHLLASQNEPEPYIEAVRGIYAFDPTEISGRVAYTPYAFGWSQWHLEKEVRRAGFTDVAFMAPEYHEQPWRDIRMEATK